MLPGSESFLEGVASGSLLFLRSGLGHVEGTKIVPLLEPDEDLPQLPELVELELVLDDPLLPLSRVLVLLVSPLLPLFDLRDMPPWADATNENAKVRVVTISAILTMRPIMMFASRLPSITSLLYTKMADRVFQSANETHSISGYRGSSLSEDPTSVMIHSPPSRSS